MTTDPQDGAGQHPEPDDRLFAALDRNAAVNAALLASLTEADLALSDGRGGWTLGQVLTHLSDFRAGWLEHVAPPHAQGLKTYAERMSEPLERGYTLDDLKASLPAGDERARAAVRAAVREGRSFEGAYTRHPADFLTHIVVKE